MVFFPEKKYCLDFFDRKNVMLYNEDAKFYANSCKNPFSS